MTKQSPAVKALAQLELRKRKRQKSFKTFCKAVFPDFQTFPHTMRLLNVLQDVGDGNRKRVLIMMPPRYGKSLMSSRLLPAWLLFRDQNKFVGLASYGRDLAREMSGAAMDYYRKAGGEVHDRFKSASAWRTAGEGGMWASGASGPITGRGAHLLVMDDAVKGREDADSAKSRERTWEWYRGVFYTRGQQDPAIVAVGTRWHERDVLGMIIETAKASGEEWHVVMFDQAYDPSSREKLPEHFTIEPDWREEGEHLCLDILPEQDVRERKSTMGTREWAAQYQQVPIPRGGTMFRYEWVRTQQAAPESAQRVRYWDLAGTEGSGDFTAGVCIAKTPDNHFVVEDVVRGQWSPGRRDNIVLDTARADGPSVRIWIEAESGVGGSQRTQALIGKLAGFSAKSERPTGSKLHRAEPLAAQMEAGNVFILERQWTYAFVEELMSFGAGAEHDDQVDAAAGAFNQLASGPRIMQMLGRLW